MNAKAIPAQWTVASRRPNLSFTASIADFTSVSEVTCNVNAISYCKNLLKELARSKKKSSGEKERMPRKQEVERSLATATDSKKEIENRKEVQKAKKKQKL